MWVEFGCNLALYFRYTPDALGSAPVPGAVFRVPAENLVATEQFLPLVLFAPDTGRYCVKLRPWKSGAVRPRPGARLCESQHVAGKTKVEVTFNSPGASTCCGPQARAPSTSPAVLRAATSCARKNRSWNSRMFFALDYPQSPHPHWVLMVL